jgi:hypothetical protein
MNKKVIVFLIVTLVFTAFNLGAKDCLHAYSDSVQLAGLNYANDLADCSRYHWPLNGPCNDEANLSYNTSLINAGIALCICNPAWC